MTKKQLEAEYRRIMNQIWNSYDTTNERYQKLKIKADELKAQIIAFDVEGMPLCEVVANLSQLFALPSAEFYHRRNEFNALYAELVKIVTDNPNFKIN